MRVLEELLCEILKSKLGAGWTRLAAGRPVGGCCSGHREKQVESVHDTDGQTWTDLQFRKCSFCNSLLPLDLETLVH